MNDDFTPECSSEIDAAPATDIEQDAQTLAPTRPADLPEEFWDDTQGTIRTDALIASYVALEHKLDRSLVLPDEDDAEGWDRLFEAVGRPSSPDGYAIEPPHPLLTVDPEVTQALHEAGFNQKQAQLVYDLAASRLLPTLENALGDIEASREKHRLVEHFGGEERYARLSGQMRRWADSRLRPEIADVLGSSFEGVCALYEMMKRQEPELLADGTGDSLAVSQAQLNQMIADPRYWRDRDPDFVSRVTDGFRRLYQG
ncbi:MAG: hypothetical protein KDE35_14645 [Geminicoccaceae bacterium]|nr:hypothetical protein [Geminicoccaceae bacterium]